MWTEIMKLSKPEISRTLKAVEQEFHNQKAKQGLKLQKDKK